MGAALFLLLASAPSAAAPTQARLDKLVHRCAAENVVRLTALSRREVVIHMVVAERAPTASEDHRFSCVLRQMRRMPDLQFGFLGNEAIAR